MNFYVDSGGAILGVDPEKIYQGSANANTIRFVGAFASNVKVTVAFKLPTGVWTTPQLMTASTQLAGVVTSNGVQFNVWEYSIPAVVTETFGTVNMQFYVYGDAGSGNGGLIATASSSFQVERGVPITLPDPTDDYETLLRQILSALSQIEGKLNFDDTPTIGSQNPVTSDGIAKALNTKASLQEDNTFEGYNTFQNEAYFDNAAYFDAGAFMYGMTYYLTDGPNRNDYYCYLTYNISKILIRFFMSDDQFDIEIPQKGGTIALLSDLTPIEEEVSKKYDKTGGTIDGNVTVTGDLTVQGTTITENAETLDVKANVITTNSEGVPLINLSGLGIRTDATNVYGIMYDPQSDSVKLGLGSLDEDNNFTFNQGEGLPIAVRDDSTAFTDKHVIVWDAAGDKFVDGGKAVSDLPTLAGNNDFTGENTFEEAIQAKKGTVVKNSLDETNYNAGYISRNDWTYLFPSDSGTFALTKNIPTDYATQTALANTQRQVDGLYTLLEQKNEIYVQTATDTYTTRETAGGENIADGVQTPVKKITGKTVKCTNLLNASALEGDYGSDRTLTVTFDSSGNSHIEVTGGLAYANTTKLRDVCPGITPGTYTFSATFEASSPYENSSGNIFLIETNKFILRGSGSASGEHALSTTVEITESDLEARFELFGSGPPNGPAWWDNLTCSAGSSALPYMPYFSGLKNAFFKEIVSTGRNLIPYPYNETTVTKNGITFTVNNDGTVTVNGTATARSDFILANYISVTVGASYFLSGCPSGGATDKFILFLYDGSKGYADISAGWHVVAEKNNFSIRIIIYEGTTVNNLVFKPMLNYGSSARSGGTD